MLAGFESETVDDESVSEVDAVSISEWSDKYSV